MHNLAFLAQFYSGFRRLHQLHFFTFPNKQILSVKASAVYLKVADRRAIVSGTKLLVVDGICELSNRHGAALLFEELLNRLFELHGWFFLNRMFCENVNLSSLAVWSL